MTDPVSLTQRLIQCRSVTPQDDGAIPLLAAELSAAGFSCTRVDRGGIANLVARWGSGDGPVLGFNGHTDVVPPGSERHWTHDPFAGTIADGKMYGRGAADMKSGVAAFVAAAIDVTGSDTPPVGDLLITITGDEEGDAHDGTRAILDWMTAEGIAMDACLVGEPTCPESFGEMMKIGRRGSMTTELVATGRQGHVAYPHRAQNPLPVLCRLLSRLTDRVLDRGTMHFDPSTLALTTIDVGNPSNNTIPARAHATFNIRFNDAHTSKTLTQWIEEEIEAAAEGSGVEIDAYYHVSGESFLTEPNRFTELVANAVESVTGQRPVASTSGGTSDARFIRKHCPVVEFGLVGKSMHQVDEHVQVEQIGALRDVYARIIRDFFATPA